MAAGSEGACGFALVLALSQMREYGLGPFGCADLHSRRNPLPLDCGIFRLFTSRCNWQSAVQSLGTQDTLFYG
jgi:hypothetical protein